MKKFIGNLFIKFIIACTLLILLFTQSISFAWLSTAWNGGEFELTAASTNTPLFELWTYHKTSSTAGGVGWYKTYNSDTDNDNSKIPKDKAIERISVENHNASTFTPKNGDFSLYFGTINNLVQEQDNVPVYMKFTIKLHAKSKNEIRITYKIPDGYVRPYLVDGSGVGTLIQDTVDTVDTEGNVIKVGNGNLLTELNNRDFLNMSYYFDLATNTNYSLASATASALPEGFDDLFETASANLHSFGDFDDADSPGTDKIIMTNTGSTSQDVYMYFKFWVPTETLQEALLNTRLKSNMPMYLIFDAKFNIEVVSISGQ